MSDDSTKTMWATFATREAADHAVEHLVQQCGIIRTDVFVEPEMGANTAGTAPSGGDATRVDAPLHGEIRDRASRSSQGRTSLPPGRSAQCEGAIAPGRTCKESPMAIIPTEPSPGPSPVPNLPPIGEPSPPIKEPEHDHLPDEEPNPNPDENDEPAKQTGLR